MHQYLFYIGDFPIRSYGVVISLSILLATGVAYFLAKADGRGCERHVPDIGIYCGIAGLLGARLWDVFFFDWDYYQHHLTELLNVWQGGMAIQGGVFLGVELHLAPLDGERAFVLGDFVLEAAVGGIIFEHVLLWNNPLSIHRDVETW